MLASCGLFVGKLFLVEPAIFDVVRWPCDFHIWHMPIKCSVYHARFFNRPILWRLQVCWQAWSISRPCTSCGDGVQELGSHYLIFGPRTGFFSFYSAFWAGNCCLRQPFSPVLEPRQGGGILIYAGLVNLAQDTSIYAHLAVQAWGNPSAWRHVPEAPHLLVLSEGPIPSEPLPVHSSPNFAHKCVCVFSLHAKTLNSEISATQT